MLFAGVFLAGKEGINLFKESFRKKWNEIIKKQKQNDDA